VQSYQRVDIVYEWPEGGAAPTPPRFEENLFIGGRTAFIIDGATLNLRTNNRCREYNGFEILSDREQIREADTGEACARQLIIVD
jgi:hypothetical protein